MSEQIKPKSRNDRAWEALFEKYDILSHIESHGKFIISASQIKEYREPRLMAKFDHIINLPQIFAKNQIAILPVSRGDYMLSRFKAYQPFEGKNKSITRICLPANLQSLNANHIPSEAIAINCALASGMLADFLEEEVLYATVSGRMGSGRFDFHIQNSLTKAPMTVSVNNSQIEIDAAFEGAYSLSLLEAKRDLSEDFFVRQLYYPYRAWKDRVSKKVRPVFLVYSNGIFSLYEYEFQDPDSYNSLVLLKHKNYSIDDTKITLSDLQPPYENGFYAGCANDCRDYAEGGSLQGWEYEHICAALIHNQRVDKLDVWINRVIFHTASIFVIFFSRHDIHKEKDYGNFLL